MNEKKIQAHDVNNLMRHVWILALLAAIALAGCSGESGEQASSGGPDAPRISGNEIPGNILNPSGEMTDAEKQRLIDEGLKLANKAVEDIKIPAPGSGDWEPTTENLSELGSMVDSALIKMTNARCDARITFGVPVGVTDMQVRADIRNARMYNIGFVVPEHFDSLGDMAVADSERRAMLLGAEWEELPPFSPLKSRKMNKADIEEFVVSFTKDMFAPYLESEAIWEPLFTALQAGVGGYETVVEKQEVEGRNQTVSIIRVYAKTTEGVPTEIEIKIDEKRHVPVRIRVVQDQADGFEFKMMWVGVWAFGGGQYAPGTFLIPVASPDDL